MSSGGQQRRRRGRQSDRRPARQQEPERLPDAHRTARGARSAAGVEMFEAYQGLLPHPEHLARFNEISPGAADKIIDEFVKQGAHRRTLEAQVVDGNETRGGRGQPLGFALLALAILCGLVIALAVDATVGGSVIGGTIASGAIIYVVGGRPPKSQ